MNFAKLNCDECLELLDEYANESLPASDSRAVAVHLEICQPCRVFHQDLIVILDSCAATAEHLEAPPNAQALWLRISNTIECEQQIQCAAQQKQVAAAIKKRGWWTRAMETSWKMSLQQIVAACAGVAVIASLLTIVALENNLSATSAPPAALWSAPRDKDAHGIEIENRLKRQQLAIDYWNRRVSARKHQWNNNLRSAFDRNLNEIDSVVADYEQQLQRNPDDEISEEMLDSALEDKMELLREFAEL